MTREDLGRGHEIPLPMVKQPPTLTAPWTASSAAVARLRPAADVPLADAARAAETRYQRTTLENGLRVVTEAMPAVRSVTLGLLVQAGPRDEAPAQAGLAHLTEHLLFQGTSNRDARQIARFMDL